MIKNAYIKISLMLCVFWLLPSPSIGQENQLSALLEQLSSSTNDSVLIATHKQLGYYYQHSNQDKAIAYFQKGLELAEKTKDSLQMANILYSIGYTYGVKQEIPDALENYLNAIRIYEQLQDSWRSVNTYMGISNLYFSDKDIDNQLKYLKEAEKIIQESNDSIQLSYLYGTKGIIYDQRIMYDSALVYLKKSLKVAELIDDPNSIGSALANLGLTYKHIGNSSLALSYYDDALDIYKGMEDDYALSVMYNNIGSAYTQQGNYTEAQTALETSIEYGKKMGAQQVILQSYQDLADLHSKAKNYKEQAISLQNYYHLKDSLFTIDKDNQVARLESEYILEKKDLELEASELKIQKKQRESTVFVILIVSGTLALILLLFYFNRSKKKNQLLKEQNNLIKTQKKQLETSLSNLKSAQAQLIQSEKMASLGELTAGIAHEIQNPLNFVNNFSEVNKELLEEMQEEIDNGDFDEVKAIMEDVVQNLEKINHHGQRADSIVKGMLQHSRTGGKQKEPTDINKLADEYLRLAYHGMRAKDKSFNVEITSNFDENLPLVSIIPQDIGRVMLNLLTNAFYAVSERQEELKSHGETDYKPTVTVTTKFFPLPGGDPRDGSIEITVKDNGGGIPKEIVDKIFQPFFTTKPTGEGTGLGLSMSYDIVTKGHGGNLRAVTKEGVPTTFIITLPV